jgi:hypothetical protein
MKISEAISKSVFLFGAGASFDAGCKLSSAMLKDLQQKITTNDQAFDELQKEALKFLLSSLEYQNKWRSLESNDNFIFTPNIEELILLIRRIKNRENFLPFPITGNWADRLINLESEFNARNGSNKNLFEEIEKSIKQLLIKDWLIHKDLGYLSPLRDLFQDTPSDKFQFEIVSLNYDMTLEEYFSSLNMPPWRGFSNNFWRGFFGEDQQDDLCRINLYKIHGSLDWVRLNSGEAVLNNNLTNEERENIDPKHDPYIIFGHGIKTFSVEPFFSLLQSFRGLLRNRNYIFTIGYSFFDPYINNLLLEALNLGGKKLVIVNPNFGPNGHEFSLSTEQTFYRGQNKDGIGVEKILADYIEEIQKNSFYSEMPEFNINKVSGESSLFYIPIGTKKFFQSFFQNGASLLIKMIEEFEHEEKEDTPF